ncbi:MAG: DUF4366 domain-containing protein [Lachnospiraceae bacterium]|nr:DUF4366 domain-containing protein [Lachnospiraceae bacterium]
MRNSKKNKFLRAGAILALSMTLLMGSAMSVFAYADGDTETSGVTVEETLDNEPEETESETEEISEAEETDSSETESEETEGTTGGSLTPDGNLTLVDDLSEEDSEAMEFITVTTKSGNYFYLIIDRSSDEENVYFLNLVDESDLMALMDEEEQEAYSQTTEITETEETDAESEEVVTEEEAETDTEAEETLEESGSGVSSSLLILIVLVVIGGAVAGGYYFLKIKPGKNGSSVDEDMEFYDDEEYENEDEEEIEFVDLDDAEDEE